MTLIELLVSLAILAIISGTLATAFYVGFRVLGTTGAQARFVGDNDLMAFEQQIGADVNRAVCLKSPQVSNPAVIPSGGCTSSVAASTSTCQPGALLCLAWYSRGHQPAMSTP